MKVYVVMESYGDSADPIKVFKNPDDAIIFCREKNWHTCHTFYFDEVDFVGEETTHAHTEECVEEIDDNSLYYDDPDEWVDEVGFDPYMGCYTDDC